MKKLICDRCGSELKERDEINMALMGQDAWEKASEERGSQARGIIPCKNYMRCGGEMQVRR